MCKLKLHHIGALLLALFIQNNSYGKDYNETLIKNAPAKNVAIDRNQFLTLTVENDLFGNGSDRNYTSGVLLTYFDSAYRPVKIARFLNKHVPFVPLNNNSKISISLGQNLYTPSDITIKAPQPDDHPWAGFLYGAIRSLTITNNRADDLELTLGVVGPSAKGKETQKFIHDLVNARNPSGWNNQLHDEPGVILSWGRRWLKILDSNFNNLSFTIEPNLIGSVGNVYTLAETGFIFRVMPLSGDWMDTPLLIRPSMPGSSFFHSKNGRFNWFAFTGAQGRVVGRNIFLDGNTFRSSPSVDKKPLVFDITGGFALVYSKMKLSYTSIYRSKEFYGQKGTTVYGNISLGYSFL